MADSFGALDLPASATVAPIGDPALLRLGNYLQAVLNVKLATAWAVLRPRAGDLALPVRTVFTHNPKRRSFDDSLLPALFVYRVKGAFLRDAAEYDRDHSDICVLWIYPPDTQEKDVPREPFSNAVAKVARAALELARHPDWADAGDPDIEAASVPASTTSFLLAKQTQTSLQTYSGAGLDGARGASTLSPRLALQLHLAAAPSGTYNTAAPIVVTYVNLFGDTVTASLAPPTTTGPSALSVGQDMRQLVSIAVPAQTTTAGSISAGNPLRSGRGSNFLSRCGFARCDLKSWQLMPFAIDAAKSGGQKSDTFNNDMVEMHLDVTERFDVDLSVADGVSANTGADLTVLQGEPFDDGGSFTIERTLD